MCIFNILNYYTINAPTLLLLYILFVNRLSGLPVATLTNIVRVANVYLRLQALAFVNEINCVIVICYRNDGCAKYRFFFKQ